MDAGFIGSVAALGDRVEIRLTFGEQLVGTLVELTADRMQIRQDDGADVALSLRAIVMMRRLATAPAAAERNDSEDDDPLVLLGRQPVLPLRFKPVVSERANPELESILNTLAYAERVHELSPRSGRVTSLYDRARQLRRENPRAPYMYYLCAVLAILVEDYRSAYLYIATSTVREGDDEEHLRLRAIASARVDNHDAAVSALVSYFHFVPPSMDDPLWSLLLRVLDRYGHNRVVLHPLLRKHVNAEQATRLIQEALVEAEEAYRKSIRQGEQVESSIKELAWLTRHTTGPDAALRVITTEFAGLLGDGDALDTILIDFHIGAKQHREALVLLDRQSRRSDTTTSRRNRLREQIAYIKLVAGEDSVDDWATVLRTSHTSTARRGMALALVQRGDLDRAEKILAQDEDDWANDIRRHIERTRKGVQGDDRYLVSDLSGMLDHLAVTPLVAFVMEHYSSELAAAVQAGKTGRSDFLELLCSGLTAVADVLLARDQPESARELCLEALRVSERLDTIDARPALDRFLCSLDGRTPSQDQVEAPLETLIAGQHAKHGNEVFDLVTQLVAQVDVASKQVLGIIGDDPGLRAAAASYLAGHIDRSSPVDADAITRAWQLRGAHQTERFHEIADELWFLRDIRLSDGVLAATSQWLHQLGTAVLDPTVVERFSDSLHRVRGYLHETAFEAREDSLRLAATRMQQIQRSIQHAPTILTVELLWPVCAWFEHVVDEARRQMIVQSPPEPTITHELGTSTVDAYGVITVQVNVSNAMGAAPLESPALVCGNSPEYFQVEESTTAMPSIVRGGQHHIQIVRLRATDKALAERAFTLPVSLRYNSRGTDSPLVTEVPLPIRLQPRTDFRPIRPNPFQEGASGKAVTDPEMFVGRGDVLRRILQHFESARTPGSGIAIFGQKRAGKSSIRIHLGSELRKRPDFIVADVANIGMITPHEGDSTRMIAQVLWEILTQAEWAVDDQFHGKGPDQRLSGEWTRRAFIAEDQPVTVFAELVRDYLAAWPPDHRPTLVVLIDEFQYFDQWIRQGLLAPSFMQSLKAVIERRLFHLVIVGQDALERLIADHANVFGVFATERVTYLDSASAQLLIDRPIMIDGHSRFRGVAKQRIAELTGGSAFYIQRFCFALVEYMNQQQAPLVTEADVEQVRSQVLQTLRAADFHNLETAGYTDPDQPDASTYRSALLAVARASRNGLATYDRVKEAYEGSAPLRPLLDDLVLRDVVRQESGGYRIVVRLYQDWLLSRVAQTGSLG